MQRSSTWCRDLIAILAIVAAVIAGHIFSAQPASAAQSLMLKTGIASEGYSSTDAQRCRGTLRSIGTSQLAYATFDTGGRYGTLSDLQLSNFINSDYTLSTIAPGYTLGWFLNEDESDFAIVALPNDPPDAPGFMIDARQTLMIITPDEIEDPDGLWARVIDAENAERAGNRRYGWVELPNLHDAPREFNLYLSNGMTSFALSDSPPFVNYSDRTGAPVTEYLYLSSSGLYYSMLPDEVFDPYYMDGQ